MCTCVRICAAAMCVHVCKHAASDLLISAEPMVCRSQITVSTMQTNAPTQTPLTHLLVSPKSKHALHSISAQNPAYSVQEEDFPAYDDSTLFCSHTPTLSNGVANPCTLCSLVGTQIFFPKPSGESIHEKTCDQQSGGKS